MVDASTAAGTSVLYLGKVGDQTTLIGGILVRASNRSCTVAAEASVLGECEDTLVTDDGERFVLVSVRADALSKDTGESRRSLGPRAADRQCILQASSEKVMLAYQTWAEESGTDQAPLRSGTPGSIGSFVEVGATAMTAQASGVAAQSGAAYRPLSGVEEQLNSMMTILQFMQEGQSAVVARVAALEQPGSTGSKQVNKRSPGDSVPAQAAVEAAALLNSSGMWDQRPSQGKSIESRSRDSVPPPPWACQTAAAGEVRQAFQPQRDLPGPGQSRSSRRVSVYRRQYTVAQPIEYIVYAFIGSILVRTPVPRLPSQYKLQYSD